MLSNYILEKEKTYLFMTLNLQSKFVVTTHPRPSYALGWDWFRGINWDEKYI